MSRLAERLLAARPPEPEGAAFERAAVRVLARVAVLQGARAPARATLARRVATALAAACLALGLLGSDAMSPGVVRPGPGPDLGPEACLEAALAGDRTARRCLGGEGARGRERLWAVLARGDARALTLLAGGGSRWEPTDAARAVALAEAGPQRARLLAALAETCAPGLCSALGGLLVRVPDAESECVAALRRAAARGRRAEALDALLAGASAGRSEAAAAAVALGPPTVADRLLVLAPAHALTAPASALALGRARPTQQAQVVARARAGHGAALAWAAAARLEGVVPLLAEIALGSGAVRNDAGGAQAALEALAAYGTPDGWVAVARAADGPEGAHARGLLAGIPSEQAEALAYRARREMRDRPAALLALSWGGPAGFGALERLASVPALLPDVLAALADAPSAGAAAVLARLAGRLDSALPVLAALERRLAAGHGEAGLALLELTRGAPTRRAALRALEAAGPRGEVFLTLAGEAQGGSRPSPTRRATPPGVSGRSAGCSY